MLDDETVLSPRARSETESFLWGIQQGARVGEEMGNLESCPARGYLPAFLPPALEYIQPPPQSSPHGS